MDLRRSNRHFIVGVVILVVGVILLLDQIGIVSSSRIFMFWPLALVYFGYYRFTHACTMTGRFWGGFWLLLGVSLQAEELGYGHIRFDTIWPVLLICAGILLILKRYEGRNYRGNVPPEPPPSGGPTINIPPWTPPSAPTVDTPPGATPSPPSPADQTAPGFTATPPPNPAGASNSSFHVGDSAQTRSNFAADRNCRRGRRRDRHLNDFEDNMRDFGRRMDEFGERMHQRWHNPGNYSQTGSPRLEEVNIFWGGKRRIVSKSFTGGEVVAIFGGYDIDLTECDMQGNQIEIEVVSIFGGGEIRVPRSWEVVMDTAGIFGGCSDRTYHYDHPAPGATNPDGSPVPQQKKVIIKGVAIFGGLNVKN
jgi:hypothetical protein